MAMSTNLFSNNGPKGAKTIDNANGAEPVESGISTGKTQGMVQASGPSVVGSSNGTQTSGEYFAPKSGSTVVVTVGEPATVEGK